MRLNVDVRRFRLTFDFDPAKDEKALVRLIRAHDESELIAVEIAPTRGLKTKLQAIWRHDEEELAQKADLGSAALHLEQALELKPGENLVELSAFNEGAKDALEETRLALLALNYQAGPADRPEIVLERLVVLPSTPGGTARTVPVVGRNLGVIETPEVQFVGRVTAKDRLRRVEWRYAGAEWRALGQTPRRSWATVCLHAGGQASRRSRASQPKSCGSGPRSSTKTTTRQARRPSLISNTARPCRRSPISRSNLGDRSSIPAREGDPARVRLSARIVGDPVSHPLDNAEILVNGSVHPTSPRVDANSGSLAADVPLRVGTNRIEVRLSNAFGSSQAWPVEEADRRRVPASSAYRAVRDQRERRQSLWRRSRPASHRPRRYRRPRLSFATAPASVLPASRTRRSGSRKTADGR